MIKSSVLIAIQSKQNKTRVCNLLRRNGYYVISVEDGNSLIRTARLQRVDLIIIDDEIKGIPAIELVNIIYYEKIAPVLICTSKYGDYYMNWINKGWIYNFINSNIDNFDLEKLVNSSIINGNKILELEKEISQLKKVLSDRKVIEKAKGIVMDKKNCSEEEAYQFIRSLSMKKGKTIEIISKAIINKY